MYVQGQCHGGCSLRDYQSTQKMKFAFMDFFSKCDQIRSKCDRIRRKLRIRSHLLKKSSMENFIFSFFVQCQLKFG